MQQILIMTNITIYIVYFKAVHIRNMKQLKHPCQLERISLSHSSKQHLPSRSVSGVPVDSLRLHCGVISFELVRESKQTR